MASSQQPNPAASASPAARAPRQSRGRSNGLYARSMNLHARGEAAPTAPTKSRTTPARRAPASAEYPPVASASRSVSSGSVRMQRHSGRASGESVPTSINNSSDVPTEEDTPPPFITLSRHHSQPSKHTPRSQGTPGTPGMRSRVLVGGSGGTRTLSMTPSTHSASYSLGMSASLVSPSRASASAATSSLSSAAALPSEDVLRKIFAGCLPTVFEALAKYQYQQATSVLDKFGAATTDTAETEQESSDVRREWRSWDAFAVTVRLVASCESSYHLMRYLEPDMLPTSALEQLYRKLIVLLNHLVEEIEPVVRRARQKSNGHSVAMPGDSVASRTGSTASDSGLLTELERLTTGDLEYYYELLEQASEFFTVRAPMIDIYRRLATQPPPHDYDGMAKLLEQLMTRCKAIAHPLLVTLRDSTVEELRTVKHAFHSELSIAQYEFTKSMVALHRFKSSLRLWSDHIDSVSEYPLFDESDEDDAEYALSGSVYSNATSGSSTLHGHGVAVDGTDSALTRRESSFRRRSFTQTLASASEMLAFSTASEHAIAASSAAGPPESQNAFSRLLSQRGSLLKKGLSISSLRPKPGPPTTPTNALEHAILGSTPSIVPGLSTSLLTPSGNALGSVGAIAGGGFSLTNTRSTAAEMVASAVAKQEREDGYALPVYQWSKRFYRSLVAKFTLYFHRWLEPFENHSDALAPYDLTRFIRSPVGISYLQLMDVLLAKGSQRMDEGSATVMLVLETDKLPNKGAGFYANGYLCPGFSRPETKPAADVLSTTSTSTSKQRVRTPVVATALSPSSAIRSSTSSSPSHSLFNLNLEPEAEEDESSDFAPLWGLRGWPAVFCYPQSIAPLAHWPNIVSLIMDNRYVLETRGAAALVHTERRLKASYYITSIDPAVYLVLLLEGKRRPSDKIAHDFMQTMAENLQHGGVYQRGGGGSGTGSSANASASGGGAGSAGGGAPAGSTS